MLYMLFVLNVCVLGGVSVNMKVGGFNFLIVKILVGMLLGGSRRGSP